MKILPPINPDDHDRFDTFTISHGDNRKRSMFHRSEFCRKDEAIENAWAYLIFSAMLAIPSAGFYAFNQPWPALIFASVSAALSFGSFVEFRVSKNFR